MAYALSGERSRGAARSLGLLVPLFRRLVEARAAARRRKMLSALMEMDDYRLWDMGIGRGDLAHALRSDAFDIDRLRDRHRALDVWPPR
jgi:uncharacterized protein YjiS (DUF1127 family)